MAKQVAIIWDSMTGASKAAAEAAAAGAGCEEGIKVRLLAAGEAGPDDLVSASGYLFVFPERLASISGMMKDFFDRCYYPLLGKIEARPYALLVCAGSDGHSAVVQAERIALGWRLRKFADSQIICTNAQTTEAILAPKTLTPEQLALAMQSGATLAAGLSAGVF